MAWYEETLFYHIYPLGLTGAPAQNAYEAPVSRLNTLLRPYGSPVSIVFGSPKEHGGGRAFRSEQERLERCERGEKMIRDMVDRMDLETLKQAIDEYHDYIAGQVQALSLTVGEVPADAIALDMDGWSLNIKVEKAS